VYGDARVGQATIHADGAGACQRDAHDATRHASAPASPTAMRVSFVDVDPVTLVT